MKQLKQIESGRARKFFIESSRNSGQLSQQWNCFGEKVSRLFSGLQIKFSFFIKLPGKSSFPLWSQWNFNDFSLADFVSTELGSERKFRHWVFIHFCENFLEFVLTSLTKIIKTFNSGLDVTHRRSPLSRKSICNFHSALKFFVNFIFPPRLQNPNFSAALWVHNEKSLFSCWSWQQVKRHEKLFGSVERDYNLNVRSSFKLHNYAGLLPLNENLAGWQLLGVEAAAVKARLTRRCSRSQIKRRLTITWR